MKVGLYFGSFNPVHHGHLIIAQYFLNNTDFKEIWFIVSPQNPLKKQAGLLHESHRYYLLQLAIEDSTGLRASNIEFFLPKPSYTIDTMQYLTEKYPGKEFSIIMGSDSLLNIEKWKNWKQLLSNFPVFIYQRPGFVVKDEFKEIVTVMQAPLLEISSTLIRNLIKEKKSIRFLVPDIVREEIEKENYYNK